MRILNGTGILLHTNLGRARMDSHSAAQAAEVAAVCYDLEYDVKTGKRGDRFHNVDPSLCKLTGAESSVVVNNNAAAVMLVVNSLACGKEVIVSRGELVEIGGSFRIPEIVTSAGGKLVLTGASNYTTIEDYRKAITDKTGLILKIHRSNFRQEGEVFFPSTKELVKLGDEYSIPVVEDVGSGSLLDIREFGLPYEPTVQEVVANGVALVTFSGDKLLGGPQCGIIVGKLFEIELLKKNNMLRALRVGKVIDALLAECLMRYVEGRESSIPFVQMARASVASLQERAKKVLAALLAIGRLADNGFSFSEVSSNAQTGAGACPEYFIPSVAIKVFSKNHHSETLRTLLLSLKTPVAAYVSRDEVFIDLRSLLPLDDSDLIEALSDL